MFSASSISFSRVGLEFISPYKTRTRSKDKYLVFSNTLYVFLVSYTGLVNFKINTVHVLTESVKILYGFWSPWTSYTRNMNIQYILCSAQMTKDLLYLLEGILNWTQSFTVYTRPLVLICFLNTQNPHQKAQTSGLW